MEDTSTVLRNTRPANMEVAAFIRQKIEERLPHFRELVGLTDTEAEWLAAAAYVQWMAGTNLSDSEAQLSFKQELAGEIDELLKGRKGRRASAQRKPCSAAAVVVFELACKDNPRLLSTLADYKNRAASTVEWLVDKWAGPVLPYDHEEVIEEVIKEIREQGGMGALHRIRMTEMNADSARDKAEQQRIRDQNAHLLLENEALKAGISVEELLARKAVAEKENQQRKRLERWSNRIVEGTVLSLPLTEPEPDAVYVVDSGQLVMLSATDACRVRNFLTV